MMGFRQSGSNRSTILSLFRYNKMYIEHCFQRAENILTLRKLSEIANHNKVVNLTVERREYSGFSDCLKYHINEADGNILFADLTPHLAKVRGRSGEWESRKRLL